MADLSTAVLGRIPDGAVLRQGVVDTVSPLMVALDGVPVPAQLEHPMALAVGEPVNCAMAGGVVRVMGSAASRPQYATVAAVAGSTVAVTAGSWSMSGIPILTGSVPAVGATVALLWGAAGAYAIASAAAPAAPPSPAAESTIILATPAEMDADRWEDATIDARATAVRTSRSGAWRTDGDTIGNAYQGHYAGGIAADNSGWFFYGGALDAPGGVATACTLRLIRPRAAGNAGTVNFRLRLHTGATVGASPPSLTADAEKVAGLSWGDDLTYNLDTAWGQKFLDGTASGIALVYAGTTDYGRLRGPSADYPLAGQLIIRYRRKVS